MVRGDLRERAQKTVNRAALDAHKAYTAQQELEQQRDEAAQAIREMVAAFAGPVMEGLRPQTELDPDDYAALVVDDPEDILPDSKHPSQPGTGAGRLSLDVNVGCWGEDGDYQDFRVGHVLPVEGEPQEITAVGVRAGWRLVEPTTHGGKPHSWEHTGDVEVYGFPPKKLAEAELMTISAPPTFDQREAVGALVRAALEQRRNFAETWPMFEEFRGGAPAPLETSEEVAVLLLPAAA